jgi:hypothetical protein
MALHLRTIAHLSLLLAIGACKEPPTKTSAVGHTLRPFIIMDGATGDRYCQICAYGPKPKIVVFADVDDRSVEADLTRVQQLVDRYQEKGLVAFAVFGRIASNGFTPVTNDEKTAAELKAMRDRLSLTFPVTVVPASYTEKEKKGYAAFVDTYDIPATRRLLYGDANNTVVFAETITDAAANDQFAKLEAELAKL